MRCRQDGRHIRFDPGPDGKLELLAQSREVRYEHLSGSEMLRGVNPVDRLVGRQIAGS
jgi:hypothetical protein